MTLTPEDAEKIRLKALANIIRKIQEGRTPTGRESAMLEEFSRGGHSIAPASAYAGTQQELAQRLKISRKTITNHQRDAGAPVTRADGRYDVAAWSQFLREREIIDEGGDDPATEKKNWKHELDRLKCEEIQLSLDTARRDLVSMGEVAAAAGRTVTAFRTALNQLPGRIAQSTVGLKDYDEIKDVAESEVNILLRSLEHASFLDDEEENKPVLGEVEPDLVEEDPDVITQGTKLEKPIRGRVKIPAVKVPKVSKTVAKKRKSKTVKVTKRS